MSTKNRIHKLQESLKNPILIKKKENLFYLTGRSFDYRAEEYLLVKPAKLINTNKRRINTKADVVAFGSGLENITWVKKSDRLKNIGEYLKGFKQLDIEWNFTLGELEYLKFKIKDKGLRLKIQPSRSEVDVMRQVKEAEELAKIKKSMEVVGKIFSLVRKEISRGARSRSAGKRLGITEIKLAQFIQNTGLKMGAEDISFPAIVASGANAAIPHHVPSTKLLKAGESIIIDFGFKYKNYCSDFTRTVFLKKVPKKLEIAYNQVEKAYNGSMNYINQLPLMAAIKGENVYQKAVDILAEKKLDKYFIHSLGHGTGLEIHELPNLSPKSKDELKNGMVFSIEPGVYMPKVGGIRIEDLVYLKNNKVEKFINVSTKLGNQII